MGSAQVNRCPGHRKEEKTEENPSQSGRPARFPKGKRAGWFSPLGGRLITPLLGAAALLLLTLAFPNPILSRGWGAAAFLAFYPLFLALRRTGYAGAALGGGFFGFVFYLLHNYWLITFHPVTIFVVPLGHVFFFVPLFVLLKYLGNRFPRTGFLFQAFLWVGYEYLKTRGFLGYSYGLAGYSQAQFLPLLQLARWTGVWGLSFLVVLPGSYIASRRPREMRAGSLLLAGFYALLLLAGWRMMSLPGPDGTWRVSLIQQDSDPWKGGVDHYAKTLDILLRLSREAEKENPDIIVWSETAFVPAVYYHTRYRPSPRSYRLVRRLRSYLEKTDTPYLIGNDDGRRRADPEGGFHRIDYNAALLFEQGEIRGVYRKRHLVPFTEHFPYGDLFPWVVEILENVDTHFWEPGEDWTVFESGGVSFSVPICFEDTFGYLTREFVRRGADVLVNISNDAWSGSVPAMEQHLQMAVFRAVETGRAVVRSTNNGITCLIDPAGEVVRRLPPKQEGVLTVDVPVSREKETLYIRWGNWFGLAALAVGLLAAAGGAVPAGRKKESKTQTER